jgi:hypothetical protein
MAKVHTKFFGVRDGEIYPEWIEPGEIISGDLAREAKNAGWATDDDAEAGVPAPEVPREAEPSAGDSEAEEKGDGADEAAAADAVVVPADWESLTWPQMRSLALKISKTGAGNKPAAVETIKAHLAAAAAGDVKQA